MLFRSAWTLQYQIFFYFIFAILIADLRCGIVSILAIFVLYMTGLINGTSNLPFPLSFLAQDYFLLFCMGMLIALMINKLKPIHFFYFQYFVLLGLTIFFTVALDVIFDSGLFSNHRTLFYGTAASFIVFGLVSAENGGKIFLEQPWIQLLGDSSYALYLIHFPLISLFCKIAVALDIIKFGLLGAIASFIAIFGACQLTAIAIHLWIERPLMKRFALTSRHADDYV